MDVMWVSEAIPEEPDFGNDASPYAHYWLSMLPADDDKAAVRRGAVDLTQRLNAGMQDLLDRAFRR